MHGIISKEKWHRSSLLKLHACVDHQFPLLVKQVKRKKVKIVNISKIQLEDACPFCFKSIVFKSDLQHNKRCVMSEQMKNEKFNVTQYQTVLLKMYPSANFEKTLWMRTADEDVNHSSLIFNEKYNTTVAEYHKKKSRKEEEEESKGEQESL